MELVLRAHNDDPRVPVLINPTVFSTIPDIRFSGTPFDCSFIPLFFLQTLKRAQSLVAVVRWESGKRAAFSKRSDFSTAQATAAAALLR